MMMLELLTATAVALLALAWWMRRAALRPARVITTRTTPADTGPCAPTVMLMSAPTDTASSSTPESSGAQKAQQPSPPQQPPPPPRPKRKPTGPNRRQFLKWGMAAGTLGSLSAFGVASLAFIWPNLRGGFGARIPMGTPDEILAEIGENQGRFEFPQARSLVVAYDPSLDPDGEYADLTNGAPVMALYQKCVHLGCKVPWCAESQWWECPCHGSKYNRWGEWQDGPAARGLDRFVVEVVEGQVVVDTSAVITGPPRTAEVLNQPPEGPHCQDAA